jgi:hypothetical protein
MQKICRRCEADDELRQMIIKRLTNGWRVGVSMAKAGKLIRRLTYLTKHHVGGIIIIIPRYRGYYYI